jgi:hypothetical protein
MSFIQREQIRIAAARRGAAGMVKVQLEAAAQALAWATDPTQFAPPSATITGTSEGLGDCQARLGPPVSLCTCCQND